MKVHILTDNLQKKLPFVNHGVSSRSQLPILLNFLIEAENGILRISATDLEIGIVVEIQANVEEEGGTTVPAKLFLELISSLPQGKISIQTKDEKFLEVITAKTKSILQTIPREEFPKLYEERGDRVAIISHNSVQKDIGKVVFAASVDSNRPALSGLLFKYEESGPLLVSTDGYRLSIKQLSSLKDLNQKQTTPLLIPARIIREVLILKQNDEDVEVYVSSANNQVIFTQKESIIVGRLIEAEFPNYEKIIPTEQTCKALFSKEEMQKAVKTCAIFARETSNIIKLSIQKDIIVVSANTPSVGENTVEVEASMEGIENEIAFNGKYLIDLLANIDEENITLEMNGPLNPGVFRIANDDSFLHLIMPIRVQS